MFSSTPQNDLKQSHQQNQPTETQVLATSMADTPISWKDELLFSLEFTHAFPFWFARKETLEFCFGYYSDTLSSILVVDDTLVKQTVITYPGITKIVSERNATVEYAVNGEEAVQLCKRKSSSYAVIYMDLEMPIMDGSQASKAIRALEEERITNETKKSKIICTSAKTINPAHIREWGMDTHILYSPNQSLEFLKQSPPSIPRRIK